MTCLAEKKLNTSSRNEGAVVRHRARWCKRDINYEEQEKIKWNYFLSETQALCFYARESNVHDSSDRREKGKRQ